MELKSGIYRTLRSITALAFCLQLSGCVFFANSPISAQSGSNIERRHVQPWEKDVGYANAVRVGNTLYISGYAAAGPMDKAITEVYEAHKKTLQHYGLDFTHVVKENLYTLDLAAVKTHNAKRVAFYKGQLPAATWTQVTGLYDAKMILEVELIAQIPFGK